MGHVLGIGTIWDDKGCMASCKSGVANNYVKAKCPAAPREYAALGCGDQLPIETSTGSPGSDCSHWS
jgi:hypothetical protein